MKVVHLQIGRVLATDEQNEPVYDDYKIKLNDDGTWTRFISTISVMGYVKKRTFVAEVVDIDKKGNKTNVDKHEYQVQLEEAFGKKAEAEKIDYKSELEKSQSIIAKLTERLEKLEKASEEKPKNPFFKGDEAELEELRLKYKEEKGSDPDQRWGTKKLKEELKKK